MDKKIIELLENFKQNKISIEDAYKFLKTLPYEDLGHTKVDHHRLIRKGVPEVIFGAGKTKDQMIDIVLKMIDRKHNILITRVSKEIYDEIKKINSNFEYNEIGRCAYLEIEPVEIKGGNIAIFSAGTSDLPVVEEICTTLKILGNNFTKIADVGVAGIHRLLDKKDILFSASLIIVCAGMEGALASVVAGLVDKLVIAVPTSIGYGASFGGLSALLTMLNSCSPNVVVVNIDNGFGAAYAASIINRNMRF